jgi:uncharacterized protein YecT (DUF1311 family)
VPARRKRPGARQDNRPARQRGQLELIRDAAVEPRPVPAPPAGLLKGSQRAWVDFWESAAAAGQDPVDELVAQRWILTLDEWQRALNAVRRKRTVEGSMGQPVMNPLAAWVATREAELHRLERQLGVGMRNRSELGVTFGQAVLTAHELNRMAAEEPDGHDQVVDVEEAAILAEFEEG